MNRLQHFCIILFSLAGFAQSAVSKSSPATTVLCSKNTTDYRELEQCLNNFLNNEIRKSFNMGDIMREVPYDVKLKVAFKLDTLAMIYVDKIVMTRHNADSAFILKCKIEMEKVFNRINEKTKKGEGLVAAKDINGMVKEYKLYFPLTLVSENSSPTYTKELTAELENKFKEKAIYAKREGDICLLFYEAIPSKSIAVYQLNVTNKEVSLFKKYEDYNAVVKDYPEIDSALKGTNYTLCYFFYKEYNYLYEIEKVEEEYHVAHYKYKSKQKNMIYENLLSIYYSYFQEFLLHK
jgi:hypothetical protein